MLFVLVLALFGMALIHNLYGIYLMSLIIGAMGAAAQVVMPMAATLATENKGKIVGMVLPGYYPESFWPELSAAIVPDYGDGSLSI